jgi:DNA-binding response OmpR family regulator
MMRLLLATRAPHRFVPWLAALEREGLHISIAAPEEQGLRAALRDPPEVVLLDLSGGDCPERVRGLLDRSFPGSRVGLIALAPRQCLAALSLLEVDDVLPMPASSEELLYRLRRVAALAERRSAAITIGELVIRPADRQVLLGGARIEVRLREFELLCFLASRPNRVFRREELAREVWGPEFRGSLRTVDTHIHRLRSHLGAFGREHIQTVRPVGYRMLAANSGSTLPYPGESG